MSEQITAYPLSWPMGWPRTPDHGREYGRFNTKQRNSYQQAITLAQARTRVQEELERFNGHWHTRVDPDSIVLSTNLALRLDGLPRSGQPAPDDPGATLYFSLDDKAQCIPCDAYTKVEQNIAAIAATLAALRTLERHGSGIMERAFTGFTALPPPIAGEPPWYETLGVPHDASREAVEHAYKKRRSMAHTDKGGNNYTFDCVQKAWEQYREQSA